MKRKQRKGSKALLSLLLSAVLVLEPLGTAITVRAEEGDGMTVQTETGQQEDAEQVQEQPDGEAGEEQELDNPADADNQAGSDDAADVDDPSEEDKAGSDDQTDVDNEAEGDDKADSDAETDDDNDSAGEETPADPGDVTDETDDNDESEGSQDADENDAVSENDLEDENDAVSENDLEDESKEEENGLLEGFTELPQSYQMSSAQMTSKRELAAHLDEIMEMEEGSDYVKGEVVLLVDTQEEAEQVAAAYHAQIKKFEYGVLTLTLSEGDSVAKAMRVASNEQVNLPAAWPNYYVYAFGEEPAEGAVSAESTVVSDDLIEIETTEYELEALGLAGDGVGESDGLSYSAAVYTDPYLSPYYTRYQYHHAVIGSPQAWEAGYTGSGVKVAVIDTGVNANTDLPAVTGVGENATRDLSGHGTHVAGIIAAKANGQYGVGVAPNAQLYAANALPNEDGTGDIADSMRAVRAVSGQAGATLTVDVINMSLGSFGYDADFQAIITAAYNKGVAIFAAAGNDGGNNYNYPACYDNVISIAATDQGNARASFSNYGNKVDLSAPGVDIWSTNAFEGQDGEEPYIDMSGTSMACPVAVGEAAVILSANPAELQGKTGGDKVEALLDLMQGNAVKVGSGMGAGITNLAKVFNISMIAEKPKNPNITITADGELQKVTVTMAAQSKTTIYYTINGKNPVVKNGVPDANTVAYTAPFEINDRARADVRAIAVNESGICSNVVKKIYTLKPYVTGITISGVDQVAKGKNIQLSAAVTPTYAANKAVTWEIYTEANGQPGQKIDKNTDKTLKTGVSITNKGKVAATKSAKPGTYVVKVTAKDEKKNAANEVIHTPFSATYLVTVVDAVKVNSVKFNTKKLTLARPTVTSCNLVTEAGFEAKQKDGTSVAANEFKWSSNKETVATVDAYGVVTLHKAGKAVITALANDSSGKKATCTITVQQLAVGVTITGSSVVGKSKSNTYKAVVTPADTTNKKVTWSLLENVSGSWQTVDANHAKAIGVSINAGNGKLSTTKKAVAGTYRIRAVTKDTAQITAEKDVTVKSGLITKITVTPEPATIFRATNAWNVPTETTVAVKVEGTDADLTAYEITSSDANESIAAVTNVVKNPDGTSAFKIKATGKAAGKVTITLKAADGSGKSGKCTINVNNPISGIRIAPSGGNNNCVARGKSLQLKATLEAEYGKISNNKVDWVIATNEENPKIITPQTDKTLKTGMKISASGKVTASKKAKDGWYNVYAVAKDGSAQTVYYIHVAAPTTRLSIYGLRSNMINVGKAGTGYHLPIDADTRQGGFSFSSSNPAVVSVGSDPEDARGMTMYMAAYKKGSATITIKALDGSGKSVKYKILIK